MAPSQEILKETPPQDRLTIIKCIAMLFLEAYCFNTLNDRDISQQLHLLLRKLPSNFGK